MHTAYLTRIYITLLLHISAHLTPSSGRTYVFLTKSNLPLQSSYFGTLLVSYNIKDTNLLVYNIFTMVKIMFVACYSVCNKH